MTNIVKAEPWEGWNGGLDSEFDGESRDDSAPDRQSGGPFESSWVEEQERVIGTVISTGDTPNFFQAHFRLEPGEKVHPGQWVMVVATDVQGRDVRVLARIANAHEVNPHEDALSSNIRRKLPFTSTYAPEEISTVIYRVVEIEPLEEAVMDAKDDVKIVRAVETLPEAGAAVMLASSALKVQALGLDPDPEMGLHLGCFHGDPDSAFVLNKKIIQRHVFIGGGIGSGKSYTRGVLGEELAGFGVAQVNVDVNGEQVQACIEMGGLNLVPGKDGFTLPLSALTAQDVLDAVPSIAHGSVMAELVRHAHEELLKGSLRNGQPFGIDDLVRKIDEVAPQLDAKAQSVTPAKSRVQSLSRLPYIGRPFDWEKQVTAGCFINIDCRGMLTSDLRVIVAAIARDLQRLAKAKRLPFVAFSIDEAHLVAPAGEDTVCLQVLRELARIGRHLRLGLILTTQSPQDMDKSILKRLLTRFLHAIEPDQLDALRGVFSDASQELVRQLPKLPQGVCVVTGAYETIRHATLIDVRERLTTHGGGTPDIWSDLAKQGFATKQSPLKDAVKAKPTARNKTPAPHAVSTVIQQRGAAVDEVVEGQVVDGPDDDFDDVNDIFAEE